MYMYLYLYICVHIHTLQNDSNDLNWKHLSLSPGSDDIKTGGKMLRNISLIFT